MVYNTLNKLKWTHCLRKCEIVILHRGTPQNRKVIAGKQVTEIKKTYFSYVNGKETFIPLHRVIEVREGRKILWKRGQ